MLGSTAAPKKSASESVEEAPQVGEVLGRRFCSSLELGVHHCGRRADPGEVAFESSEEQPLQPCCVEPAVQSTTTSQSVVLRRPGRTKLLRQRSRLGASVQPKSGLT